MQAKDLMTPDPTTCSPSDDLKSVIEVMREEDCGIVPITEGNGENRVVGVVTDRDIALHLGETDQAPWDTRPRQLAFVPRQRGSFAGRARRWRRQRQKY